MWVDPNGTERTSQLIEQVTTDKPGLGRVVVSLCLEPANQIHGDLVSIEIHANGRTQERRVPSVAVGREYMSKLAL